MKWKSNIIFLLLIIGLSSCKIFEKTTGPDAEEVYYRNLLDTRLNKKFIPDNVLVQNANIRVKGDNNINARVTLYSRKNELLFVSTRYLGFEVIRVLLTEDSIKYINRFNREYYFDNVDNLKSVFPINLEILQTFLYTGYYVQKDEKRKDYIDRFKYMGDSLVLNYVLEERRKMSLAYNRTILKLDKIKFSDMINMFLLNMNINYEDEIMKSMKGTFLNANDQKYNIEISNINVERKSFDKIDFHVTKNYRRLDSLL